MSHMSRTTRSRAARERVIGGCNRLAVDGVIRRQVIEQLMRQIMHYDAEFRREEATSAVSSNAKH